tara:strand:+ start:81362 stop:81790 length:429 start_codon:yes stop_codon:yes gene_type:complete
MSSTPDDTGDQTRRSVFADMVRLVGASLGFAFLMAGPAWLVAETKGLIGLSVSALLCTIPGCLIVAFKGLVGESQATLVLVAGGIRMFFVLLGALGAKFAVTGYGLKEFFIWLALFYLFTLAVETTALLAAAEKLKTERQAD